MSKNKRKSKKRRSGPPHQPQAAPAPARQQSATKARVVLLGIVLAAAFFWWQQSDPATLPLESTQAISTDSSPAIPAPTTPPAVIQADNSPKISVTAEHGTEAIAASTNNQLKAFAKIILKARTLETAELTSLLEPMLAKDFTCGPLRPQKLAEEFDDGAIRVRRSANDLLTNKSEKSPETSQHQGASGLATALQALVQPWQDKPSAWCKFKQFLIEPSSDIISTTSYYEIGSRKPGNQQEGQGIGQHARWVCRWQPATQESPPRLLNIQVSDFEETTARGKQGTLFSDCTAAVLRHRTDLENQFFHGTSYWRGRIEKRYRIPYFGQQGLAIGDVNGDGLDDIYLLQPGGLPNRLLIHQADGTVVDQSQEAGVDILDFTRSALLIDLDNDGDQDLVVSMWQRLMFLENDGQGHFTAKAVLSDMKAAYSLAAADYDQDGDLDLFACIYYPKQAAADRVAEPIPYYNATNGGKNILVRNEGNWKFHDATDEVGLGENNYRFSFAASWDDFDNDGDVDLYVANDFGPNHLYRNDKGHFSDVAASIGAEDMNFGMSASWGDFNRDGWMDLYISNMFSSAGNRVTFQSNFKSDLDDKLRNKYQKLARGNTLLVNHGGKFADVSNEQQVTVGRWAWGSLFVDVNNDGWEDLMVANGFLTGKKPDDL